MASTSSPNPKPSSAISRPEIVRLPRLTTGRRILRRLVAFISRIFTWLFADVHIAGRENIPSSGPFLVVSNHLGDADVIIGISLSPIPVEIVAKIELHEIPIFGALLDAYGVIWIHRGQPDRRAIRSVIQALAEGRVVALAPEGRESVTGALETGTEGAAYLALKADALILPITFTGSRNRQVYGNMKRLRRSHITVTIGPVFKLDQGSDWRSSLANGTQTIMRNLAKQLPIEYQGVYHL